VERRARVEGSARSMLWIRALVKVWKVRMDFAKGSEVSTRGKGNNLWCLSSKSQDSGSVGLDIVLRGLFVFDLGVEVDDSKQLCEWGKFEGFVESDRHIYLVCLPACR
jgi:hypothetical protein